MNDDLLDLDKAQGVSKLGERLAVARKTTNACEACGLPLWGLAYVRITYRDDVSRELRSYYYHGSCKRLHDTKDAEIGGL